VGWGQNYYGEDNIPSLLMPVFGVAEGDSHSVALLSPWPRLTVTVSPKAQTVGIGSTVFVAASATGSPSLTYQWYFGTRYTEEFNQWRNFFYQKKRKIIPMSLRKLLSEPLTLAVWFMDDGRLDYREKSHYAYTMSVDDFSFKEAEMLRKILKERFKIESVVYKCQGRNKIYPKLYIGKSGRDKFRKIVSPYLLSCFSYKKPSKMPN